MKKGIVDRFLVYFLCVSLLLLMNGLPRMAAEAKEKGLPIGEMVSRGEVRFEARENLWKNVESSHFPILQGMKMKTENGTAVIALENNSQIEVGQKSHFSFDAMDRLNLFEGRIDFRIPSTSEMDLKVRKLTVIKSRPLQAGKETVGAIPKSEEVFGTVSIHPNGSVTIKSFQGSLSVLGQDRAVLAALSSKESVTIPSVTASGKTMVAQAPSPPKDTDDEGKKKAGAVILGEATLSPLGLAAIGVGVGGVAVGAAAGGSSSNPKGPVCR